MRYDDSGGAPMTFEVMVIDERGERIFCGPFESMRLAADERDRWMWTRKPQAVEIRPAQPKETT